MCEHINFESNKVQKKKYKKLKILEHFILFLIKA